MRTRARKNAPAASVADWVTHRFPMGDWMPESEQHLEGTTISLWTIAPRMSMDQPASVVHGVQRLSPPPSGRARRSPSWSVPLIALAICAISRASFAQPASGATEETRVELWGAVTAGPTGPGGSVVSSYSPPLLLDGSDYTSHA